MAGSTTEFLGDILHSNKQTSLAPSEALLKSTELYSVWLLMNQYWPDCKCTVQHFQLANLFQLSSPRNFSSDVNSNWILGQMVQSI